MPPKKKPKLSKEEIAIKKSAAAKARLQKIKSDPVLLAQHKEKERLKYLKKKEKGQRKFVQDMTSREHRKIKKKWKKYSSDYRKNLKLQKVCDNFVVENTPPSSDDESIREPVAPELLIYNENVNDDLRQVEAKRRSLIQRKERNKLLQKKCQIIANLKKKLNTQLKKYSRLKKKIKKSKNLLTPKSKIEQLAEDPNQRREIVKKALFGEVLEAQITENISKAKTHQEKSNFKQLLSGPNVEKYKLWRYSSSSLTHKKFRPRIPKKNLKDKRNRVVQMVQRFYEDDSNSRAAAGKKECITRNRTKKQKRYLLDSLKNLHKKFLDTNALKIGYTLFCQLRPFWVVPPKLTDRDTCACILHENINLKLSALKKAKILGFDNHQSGLQILCCNRYLEKCLLRQCNECSTKVLPYAEFDNSQDILVQQWIHGKETITDSKTKKERIISKYKKETTSMRPRDLIIQLQNDLQKLFQHEVNIVHQYNTIKSLKQSLTEKDVVIHMDFSENFSTKCNQEIQAYHFGGSRTQISMHTVVVYTKDSTTSHCTISLNLAHNVAAIWAHLQPVLLSLPPTIENIHFLSDGPVTQYRNKAMFFILACKIQEFFPNIMAFSWNYHEAGHGKGAPDGVGATCKRIADKSIAQNADITDLNMFANTLRESCSGIKISVIEDTDIENVQSLIRENESNFKSFKGTLQVHQVTGNVYFPNKLIMKSLSCFCNSTCDHYKLGTLQFTNQSKPLNVAEFYNTDSEENIPLANLRKNTNIVEAGISEDLEDKLKVTYGSGDYVLVKFMVKKKEYRYAAICSSFDDEEGELSVTFLKVCDIEGKLFKIDEHDVADVPYTDVIEKLPVPCLKVKGDRVFYNFKTTVNVFEK
ncbi:uncharacterized protein LOC126377838 [Pectinophora gossypiella]|nr:uncharacterized protein LOC126373773 [Pectinophora gossypiella]XP_049881760.1 uncharacterized protein LOC126377838 [Pectinophora gossypiella]